MTVLRALERFAGPGPTHRAGEVCELCASAVAPEHPHVVDLERRALSCACRPCAILFTDPNAANGRYRTVPDRVRTDEALDVEEAEWTRLGIPVRLAFLFFNSSIDRWVALYPSPAGATESELELDAFAELAARTPLIEAVEPDVEAVLVRGERTGGPFEVFLVPIDVCYELVAIVRRHWRGFDGGSEVRSEMDALFDRLRRRARPLGRGRGGSR